MSRRALAVVLEILTPVLVLVAWGVWSANAGSVFFPPLTKIFIAFRENWLFALFNTDFMPSLIRLFSAFFIGTAIALIIGVLVGLSERARQAAGPTIEFMRALPPPALIPSAIVLLGIGNLMKISLISLVCIFPVLLNTIDGIRGVEPAYDETARVFGISKAERLRSIVLPAALPRIFAGMRTSLSLAVLMMVVSEMSAATNGIGYFVVHASAFFNMPDMWSGMLLLGLLGYVLNLIMSVIENRLLHWHHASRQSAS